jgi:hypothetical protein
MCLVKPEARFGETSLQTTFHLTPSVLLPLVCRCEDVTS